MALSAQEKAAIVAEHATCENDTGSPEVQVALITKRIAELTDRSILGIIRKITIHVAVLFAWLISVANYLII